MDIVPPLVQFRPNALCRRHGRQRGGLGGPWGDGTTTTLVVGPGCNPRRESRGGGVRRRRAVAVCGGGVWLLSVTSDGTLRAEMKRYVKNMSGHKFAEPGGGVLQIYVFMTDIYIIGLKIGLKRHKFVSL